MSVTINAKGTSVSTFTVGKEGLTLSQSGIITPPSANNLVLNLATGNSLVVGATSGPASITTNGNRDLHISSTGGGTGHLLLNSIRWPDSAGTEGQILALGADGILGWSSAGAGSVTSMSVVTANGFSGSVATPTTTPAVTLSTTVSGLVAGDEGSLVNAVASDITSLVDSYYVNISGDTMTGALAMGNNKITGLATPTANTDAATKAYVDSKVGTLSSLSDVNITSLSGGQYLQYNGATSKWENTTLELSDVSDITATPAEVNVLDGATVTTAELNILDGATVTTAELNILDGATVTTAELNYVDGVTSPIQTQLDGKQESSDTLDSLAALDETPGLLAQTGTDTFVKRTLVAPAAGFTITYANGALGNPTFALSDDLTALENLTGTGIAIRTGTSTWATKQIDGTSGRITVTNGNGVSGNPTVDLSTVDNSGVGYFQKLSVDNYGRVIGTTSVVKADITALVDDEYVNISGDTMTGALGIGGNPPSDSVGSPRLYIKNTVSGNYDIMRLDSDATSPAPNINIFQNGVFASYISSGVDSTDSYIYMGTNLAGGRMGTITLDGTRAGAVVTDKFFVNGGSSAWTPLSTESGINLHFNSNIGTIAVAPTDSGGSTLRFATAPTNSASAAERMRITSDGFVGIGTTTPIQALEVSGPGDGGTIGAINSGTWSAGSKSGIIFKTRLNSAGANNSNAAIESGRESFGTENNTAGFMTFSTRPAASSQVSERIRITSTGLVGINTTTPTRLLHVQGSERTVSAYQAVLEGDYNGYGAGVSFQSRTSSDGTRVEMARITADGEAAWNTTTSTQDAGLRFFTALDGTLSEKMRLDATGNLLVKGGGNLGVDTSGSIILYNSDSTNSYSLRNTGATGAANANLIITQTTGGERARFDSSGNFGIGTSSPQVRLHVGGVVANNLQSVFTNGVSDPNFVVGFMNGVAGGSSGALQGRLGLFYLGSGYAAGIDFLRGAGATDGTMTFRTSDVERARITADGLVAIGDGITTPRGNLDIGTTTATSTTQSIHIGYSPSDFYGYRIINTNNPSATGAGTFAIQRGTTAAWTNVIESDNNGNVGLGVTPNAKLEVRGPDSNSDVIRISAANNTNGVYQGISFVQGPYAKAAIRAYSTGTTDAGALTFWTSPAGDIPNERMRIDSAGNVGIGVSPSYKLTVAGDIAINNTSSFVYANKFGVWSSSSDMEFQASSANILFKTGAGQDERMRVDSTGNVLIATTSTGGNGVKALKDSAGAYLQLRRAGTSAVHIEFANDNGIVGSITTSGTTTTYSTTSDARLKENIVDAPSAGNKIDSLSVRSYDWKANGEHTEYGFVAQELHEVVPSAVVVGGDNETEKPWSVDYSKLVPMLVKEIQELRARVASLESQKG